MNPDVRIEGETYEDYKKRLKRNREALKNHMKGTIVREAQPQVHK